jgi:uncharacterized metal-binding protein
MDNSLKGALLSGLVFPGLGQLVLKHYKRGAIIIIAVLISLFIVVVEAVQRALAILEEIQLEGSEISISSISEAASRASTTSGSLAFNLALSLAILLWIIGAVDAYRIGKKKDIEKGLAIQASNDDYK